MNVEIKVHDCAKVDTSKLSWRDYQHFQKQRTKKARVYFFHNGENMIENLQNRRARPSTLYRTYLGDVAEAMGVKRDTKFSWSQTAGCGCGCSPGFICDDVRGQEVFVTLSADAPKVAA